MQATYNIGALHSDPEFDEWGQPLYLMRCELQTADNRCTTQRGKDTSYPFKWQYADGTEFSSGTKDYEHYVDETMIAGRATYTAFLYAVNPVAREQYDSLQDDDAGEEVRYADYLEMKPYYLGSSVEGSEEEGENTSARFGISPQWWKRTTDWEKAQLNYDFAYCPHLDWAETLIPGDKVQCAEWLVTLNLPTVDGYGNFMYEYVRDESGNILYGAYGRPVVPEQEFVFKTFRYYEMIPPESYEAAIDGQPAVELYIGSETVGLSDGNAADVDVETTLLGKTAHTPDRRILSFRIMSWSMPPCGTTDPRYT
ncbi:MAG: hypothetical protein FWG73_04695 [Planctomycetaceae bacterium]|nr:hypothetical protein [Planctomycetaceae bacterium]